MSKTRKVPYYVNLRTKQSQWRRPAAPLDQSYCTDVWGAFLYLDLETKPFPEIEGVLVVVVGGHCWVQGASSSWPPSTPPCMYFSSEIKCLLGASRAVLFDLMLTYQSYHLWAGVMHV